MFDYIEKPFDEIALAIQREVTLTLDLAIGFRRDGHLNAALFETFDIAVGIIAFVAEERPGLDPGGQRLGLLDVMNLTAGKAEHERVAQSIDNRMDFRRKGSPELAEGPPRERPMAWSVPSFFGDLYT